MLSVLPSGTPGWHVQTLENAAGAAVNLDQYGVAVPESGIPNGWTPELWYMTKKLSIFAIPDGIVENLL